MVGEQCHHCSADHYSHWLRPAPTRSPLGRRYESHAERYHRHGRTVMTHPNKHADISDTASSSLPGARVYPFLKALAKPISRLDQRAQVARLHDRVSGVGRDVQVSFWPGAMQIPRARDRTDNIVAPLYNHPGNLSNLAHIFKQIVFGGEETVVHKVMTLNPRKGHSELWIGEFFDRFVIKEKF